MSSSSATPDVAQGGFELHGERTRPADLIRDLVKSGGLIRILARQEFFVRYRRATFGMVWAVALPLIQASLVALVVSRFVRFETETPFAVFVYSGMLVWTFFVSSVSASATAIADSHSTSTRIYFPRAVFPIVRVMSNIYGLVLSAVILVIFHLVTGGGLGISVLNAIPALALVVALSNAFGLVFAALHVYFRDVRYLVQAAVLAWFYVTPVFYPLDRVGNLQGFIEANPMTGAIELFRTAIHATDTPLTVPLLWSVGWTLALLAFALVLYCRNDRVFADRL